MNITDFHVGMKVRDRGRERLGVGKVVELTACQELRVIFNPKGDPLSVWYFEANEELEEFATLDDLVIIPDDGLGDLHVGDVLVHGSGRSSLIVEMDEKGRVVQGMSTTALDPLRLRDLGWRKKQ